MNSRILDFNARIQDFSDRNQRLLSDYSTLRNHPDWPSANRKMQELSARLMVEPPEARRQLTEESVQGMTPDEVKVLAALGQLVDRYNAIQANRKALEQEQLTLTQDKEALARRFELLGASLAAPVMNVPQAGSSSAAGLAPMPGPMPMPRNCTTQRFGTLAYTNCF